MSVQRHTIRIRRGGRVLAAERTALEALGRPPVVVYSWSKTGSSTAYDTLSRSRLFRPVYHVHSLDDGVVERQAAYVQSGSSLGLSPEELHAVQRLRRDLQDGEGPMALVTLVRDPISRSISSFFQGHYASAIDMTSARPSPDAVAATVDELHERLPKLIATTDSWFVRQQLRSFDFDLLSEEFDPDLGYGTYRYGRFEQVVIRTDRFDEVYRQAIEPVVGRRIGPVRRANSASTKQYSAHHRATLDVFRLSSDEIEQALDSRVMAHFFSAADRDALARSWRAGTILAPAS